MPSATSASSQALDALEDCLKSALLHTGSALSRATLVKSGALDTTRVHLDRSLPEILKRWHSSLNILEAELLDATATLHRDLAASRKKDLADVDMKDAKTSPAASLDSDIVMVEAPLADDILSQQVEAEPPSVALEEQKKAEETGQSSETPVQPEADTTVTQPDKAGAQSSTTLDEPSQNATIQSDLLDLGLGPSPRTVQSQNDSPFPSIEQSSQFPDLEDAGGGLSNADVGSLLPGLMDYANDMGNGNGDVLPSGDFAKPSALSQPEPSNVVQAPLENFHSGTGDGDGALFPDEILQGDNMNFDGGFDSTFDFGQFAQDSGVTNEAGGGNFDLFDPDFFTLTGGEEDGAKEKVVNL